MRTESNLSLGVLVAGPLLLLAILFFAGLGFVLWRWARRNEEDEDSFMASVASICLNLVALIFIVGTLVGYYPYKAEYHHWYNVDGEVQKIGSRQIAQDNAMSTRYVFRIGGEDYGVDDTRASLTQVGDVVHLKCKKEFVWNSVSGWACNWNG